MRATYDSTSWLRTKGGHVPTKSTSARLRCPTLPSAQSRSFWRGKGRKEMKRRQWPAAMPDAFESHYSELFSGPSSGVAFGSASGASLATIQHQGAGTCTVATGGGMRQHGLLR